MAKRGSFLDRFRKNKISYQNLAKLNMLVAGVLGLQALAILILSDSGKGIVSITTSYLNNDVISSDSAGRAIWLAASQHLFDLHLSYVVALLLLAAGAGRWSAATFRRKPYEAGLRKGVNLHSWIEHGVVAALLMVGVALLSGIWDIVSLFFIIWLAGLISWLGYKFCQYAKNNKLTDWQLFAIALKAGAWIWIVIAIYALGALIWGRGLPTYVYWVYGSIFLAGLGFAYNTYRSFKADGRWTDKMWGEQVYVLLSVVAASALAWQIFFGALR